MELELDELIWDSFNSEHISKHNLTQEDVTQACINQLEVWKTRNGRLLLIGKTDAGKLVSVVLAPKGTCKYYPVTARITSQKERKLINEKNK